MEDVKYLNVFVWMEVCGIDREEGQDHSMYVDQRDYHNDVLHNKSDIPFLIS